MLHARAEVATATPDRFIRQLVSHLSHKATTELRSDETGVIDVHDGQCTLTSAGGRLVLEASAGGATGGVEVRWTSQLAMIKWSTCMRTRCRCRCSAGWPIWAWPTSRPWPVGGFASTRGAATAATR